MFHRERALHQEVRLSAGLDRAGGDRGLPVTPRERGAPGAPGARGERVLRIDAVVLYVLLVDDEPGRIAEGAVVVDHGGDVARALAHGARGVRPAAELRHRRVR